MPYNVGRILPDSTPGCFIWRVEDFFSYPQDQDGYFIESPAFRALDEAWRLYIYPSVNIDDASRTRLRLWKRYHLPSFNAHFEFGIRAKDGSELIAYSGEAEFNEKLYRLDSELPAHWRRDRGKFAAGSVLSVFCRLWKRGATLGNDTSTKTEDLAQVSQDCVDEPSKSCNSAGNDTSTQTEDFGQVSQACVDGPLKFCNSPGPLEVLENLKELLSSRGVRCLIESSEPRVQSTQSSSCCAFLRLQGDVLPRDDREAQQ